MGETSTGELYFLIMRTKFLQGNSERYHPCDVLFINDMKEVKNSSAPIWLVLLVAALCSIAMISHCLLFVQLLLVAWMVDAGLDVHDDFAIRPRSKLIIIIITNAYLN